MDFGAFVCDDEGPFKLANVFRIDSEVRLQRKIDFDVWWDVNERAARPHCAVKSGKFVVFRRNYLAKVLLDDFRVLFYCRVCVRENYTLLLQVFP